MDFENKRLITKDNDKNKNSILKNRFQCNLLLICSILIITIYFVLFFIIIYFQRLILYPGTMMPKVNVQDNNLQQITQTLQNNIDVAFQSNLNTITKDNLIVYFHGNGDQLGNGPSYISQILNQQFSDQAFLSPEQPSFGLSKYPKNYQVTKTEISLAMVRIINNFIKDKLDGKLPKNIVFIGQSIGTAVATETLFELNQGIEVNMKLILISPFTNLKDVIQEKFMLYQPLIKMFPHCITDNWSNDKQAGRIEKRMKDILIIHGDNDEVVPYTFGEDLHQEIRNSIFVTIDGAGHNDLWNKSYNIRKIINNVKQQIENDQPSEKQNSKMRT